MKIELNKKSLPPESLGNHLFLVGSPLKVAAVLTVWFYMISAIPKWMKNRPPYKLKTFMLVYNMLQVVLNLLLALTVSLTSLKL